jgi:transposase
MHMLADSAEVARRRRHPQAHPHRRGGAAATGAVITQVTVPATPAGYQQLLELAGRQSSRRIWAVESTGGYGAGLTRSLTAHHERVVELSVADHHAA